MRKLHLPCERQTASISSLMRTSQRAALAASRNSVVASIHSLRHEEVIHGRS